MALAWNPFVNIFQSLCTLVGADGAAIASAANPVPISIQSNAAGPTTGTPTSVTSANADTVLLAANASRKGATIFNDSTSTLNVLLKATTASATVFTAQLAAGGYYEVPFGYTGGIAGWWAAVNGSARVTELT